MCNTVITLSKVIFHSFLYVYQRVIYEDCTNLPIICFAVGIGIHWKPLETIGSTIFSWSVQSMFHGGCPIAGWFHTDNPEMADFRGPFHETSIPNRKKSDLQTTYTKWIQFGPSTCAKWLFSNCTIFTHPLSPVSCDTQLTHVAHGDGSRAPNCFCP